MLRMKFWPSAKCPRCLHPNETTEHVLHCPSISARQLALSLKNKFEQNLAKLNTSPRLRQTLISLIDSSIWNLPPTNCHPSISQEAIQAQLHLSIHDFCCGRLVTKWRELQAIHIQNNDLPTRADAWTQQVIINIWNLFFQMWLHRNECLHSSDSIKDQIYNLSELDTEIRRQWHIGNQKLHSAD